MTTEPTDTSREDHDNECARAAIADYLEATKQPDGTNHSGSTMVLMARAMSLHLYAISGNEEHFHEDLMQAMGYAFGEFVRHARESAK